MDHIPRPRNPCYPPIEVPYVVTQEHTYDGLGFSGFPQRKHFDAEGLKKAEYHSDQWNNALSFLQAWGFFGMLIELLGTSGVEVQTKDFIRERSEGQFVTTEVLPYYLRLWASCQCALDVREKEESLQRVDICLVEIHRCLGEIADSWYSLEFDSESDSLTTELGQNGTRIPLAARKILLSIMILGESISYARYFCYGYGTARPFCWKTCWFLYELMADAGWCPYEIARLDDIFIHSNTCLYYLGLVDRTRSERDHRSCTWKRCLMDEIDKNTYRTRHVQEPCTCIDAVEDSVIRQVRSVISEGNIPVITVAERVDRSAACEVRTHCSERGIRYVAISHVWLDGLGNHDRNSLPLCQLLRLQRLVNNLYEPDDWPIPFWIDTINVPLEPEERKLAIINLDRTYKEAEKVLVLDSTLLEAGDDLGSTEILMRIACSNWARRLWTLSEGILSRSLHFQCNNRAITHADLRAQRQVEWIDHIKHLCALHYRRRDHSLSTDVKSELERLLRGASEVEDSMFFEVDLIVKKLSDELQGVAEDSARLDIVSDNIRWRTTSKPEDEFICLANLLGRHIGGVISWPYEDQMKWLFSSLQGVSSSIIFHHRPRVQAAGYRWIPKSLLNCGTNAHIRGSTQIARPCSDGLKVKYPGLFLFPASDFYESEQNSTIFVVGNDESRMYYIHMIGETQSSRASYRGLELAMIFENFDDDRSMDYLPMTRALLVVIAKRQEGVLFVRVEQPLLFGRTRRGVIPAQSCQIMAQAVQPDQTWCVG
jgi:hypothetical protein